MIPGEVDPWLGYQPRQAGEENLTKTGRLSTLYLSIFLHIRAINISLFKF